MGIDKPKETYDYSWQREWRYNEPEFKFSDLTISDVIVVGPSVNKVQEEARRLYRNEKLQLPNASYKFFGVDEIDQNYLTAGKSDYDLMYDLIMSNYRIEVKK